MRFAIALIMMLTTGLPAAIGRADDGSRLEMLISKVPTARLVAEYGEQQSRIGTFCWTWRKYLIGSEGVCVDAGGLITSSEPLGLKPSETIQIDLPKSLGPADVEICWIHHPTENPMNLDNSAVAWTQQLEDCQNFSNVMSVEVLSPKQSGVHALSVFANWPGWRDAVHGFLLMVDPQG